MCYGPVFSPGVKHAPTSSTIIQIIFPFSPVNLQWGRGKRGDLKVRADCQLLSFIDNVSLRFEDVGTRTPSHSATEGMCATLELIPLLIFMLLNYFAPVLEGITNSNA